MYFVVVSSSCIVFFNSLLPLHKRIQIGFAQFWYFPLDWAFVKNFFLYHFTQHPEGTARSDTQQAIQTHTAQIECGCLHYAWFLPFVGVWSHKHNPWAPTVPVAGPVLCPSKA